MGWQHVQGPAGGTSPGSGPLLPLAAKLRLSMRSTYRMPCSAKGMSP